MRLETGSHGPVKLPEKGKSPRVVRRGCKRCFEGPCASQNLVCTSATPFRTFLLAGFKRLVAPSPNHFWEFSPFLAISEVRGFKRLEANRRPLNGPFFLEGPFSAMAGVPENSPLSSRPECQPAPWPQWAVSPPSWAVFRPEWGVSPISS